MPGYIASYNWPSSADPLPRCPAPRDEICASWKPCRPRVQSIARYLKLDGHVPRTAAHAEAQCDRAVREDGECGLAASAEHLLLSGVRHIAGRLLKMKGFVRFVTCECFVQREDLRAEGPAGGSYGGGGAVAAWQQREGERDAYAFEAGKQHSSANEHRPNHCEQPPGKS
eukprot:6181230-Pleurochrysis_carterae.AAC.1